MAKSAASDPAAILAGLRKALAGPLPLTGEGEAALFSPRGGKALANAAIEQGLLVSSKVKEKIAGKTKTIERGELTQSGRRYVLDADNPKAVLEALLPAVRELAAPQPPVEKEKLTPEHQRTLEKSFAALRDTLTRSFDRLEQQLEKVLADAAPASRPTDPAALFEALQTALRRVEAPPQVAALPNTVSAKRPLEEDIVSFVNAWVEDKTVGCQFDVLWDHLQARLTDLTIGAFQDALRNLHRAGRIRLSGWPRMLDDLPQPNLALFISSKVMYYAQRGHPDS